MLLEAELRGRATHGIVRLPPLVEMLSSLDRSPIQIVKDTPTAVLLDGGNDLGYLVAHRATELAIDKAKAAGVATGGAFNTQHTGMLGYYPLMAAKEGLFALAVCNTFPKIIPHGAAEPVYGTNPFAVGFPTPSHPLVVDFSTAAVTIGELIVASRSGEQLADGLAVDADGRPTTDPDAAMKGSVHPFGGHKGSALSFIVQILSTALTGAMPTPPRGGGYGFFTIVIDPAATVGLDGFGRTAAQVVAAVRGARPAAGIDEVLVPGERSERERRRRLEEGIDVDDDLAREALALAG